MVLFDKLEKPTESPKMFGAKVVSCSSSIGWGGQGGSCNLTLVEDPRDDSLLELPEIGTACFFKYYGFYFGGIFQRWSYKEGSSGKLYDVVLESPSKLLDGIQVVLDEFQGTVSCSLPHLHNFHPDMKSSKGGLTQVGYQYFAPKIRGNIFLPLLFFRIEHGAVPTRIKPCHWRD